MAEIIRMPRMSDTMEEGVISRWLKKIGDKVKSGDVLAEVETDKATMELESYQDGTLLYLGVKEKQAVPVDGVIAILGKKEENIDDILKQIKSEPKPVNSGNNGQSNAESSEPAAIDISKVNATVITMPRMSDTMTEGTIAKWNKKVGDKIKSGDVLAEVETDKATMELEAFENGTLLHIAVEEGKSIKVDGLIAIVGENDADYKALIRNFEQEHKVKKSEPEPVKEQAFIPVSESTRTSSSHQSDLEAGTLSSGDGKLKASPLARKLAREFGYDIARIRGTGENGRIIKRDVESYNEIPETSGKKDVRKDVPVIVHLPEIVGKESFEDVPVSQMRKTIARRLSESKYSAPHFYLTMEIDMDMVVDARNSINKDTAIKISYNDFVLKACATALRKHPKVNASWLGEKVRYYKHIHIGIAVAVDEGLLVPVIKFIDNKTLSHIAYESKELSNKARNKQLQPADWEGNTFTVSNLGMFGIEEFTAIINSPDACILAVGGIKQVPVVKEGAITIGNVMKVTLSCDHRVVDGAIGSAFLQTLKDLLENPVKMLV
jgi:pyruvate dehydrogenase E2 component (dihydrolipoamide acetyltransferase)